MSGSIRVWHVDGPLWAIGADYFSRAIVEHAKAVPGLNWNPNIPLKPWVGYPDAVAAVAARLEANGIRVDGLEEMPRPDSWRTARSPFLFATSNLREYQIEGVRFLLAKSHEGAILADGMRLGKSAQSTTAARALKQKTLVVCPSHVVGVWGRPPNAPEGPGEVAKWWPDAWKAPHEVVCLETVKPAKASEAEIAGYVEKIAHAQVVVCHYDILYAWVEVLLKWGVETLILDEVHIIAGYQSRRSDAIKTIRKAAKRCIGLSGTPMTNVPRNLHNVLDIVSPGRFGYFFVPQREGCFGKVFCDSKQKEVGAGEHLKVVWDHTGKSNLDEPNGKTAISKPETLHARMKYLMLRRLKKDVDPQLPSKERRIIDVTIPSKKVIGVSEKMLSSKDELRRCLDAAADGKLKHVIDIVGAHLDEGERVVCACYRRLFAEAVAEGTCKYGGDAAKVEFTHGGLAQKERDRRIHTLRKHDGPALLVGTIDTISTGIDLSFASVMVVAEFTWEPHELEQLEERLYAYGKDVKSFVEYVVARGTGDELIVRAIISKLDSAERVVGSSGSGLKEDLGKQKVNAMARLHAALLEMQKAAPVSTKKSRRRG